MTRRWISLLAVVGLATMVGCGYSVWVATAPTRAVAQIGSAESFRCDNTLPPGRPPAPSRPEPGTVPVHFVPVAAVICSTDVLAAPELDAVRGYDETRYEGDFAEVVRLLNQPTERRLPLAGVCPTYSVVPIPDVWLLDGQGRAVQPTFRYQECGVPDIAALSAIGNMTVASSVEYRITQDELDVRSRLSSCAPILSPPRTGSGIPGALTVGNTYCMFDITPEGANFVDTVYIESVIDTAVLTPAPNCVDTASRIASTQYVEGAASDQRQILVDLDGCRRIIADTRDNIRPTGWAPSAGQRVVRSKYRRLRARDGWRIGVPRKAGLAGPGVGL